MVVRRLPVLLGLVLVVLCGSLAPARAELRIDITRGVAEPVPVAVPPLRTDDPSIAPYGRDIAEVVQANLQRTGLFRPIDARAFIEDPATIEGTPRFADWRLINAQALITGRVMRADADRLRVEFRLWDVFAGQQMAGVAYVTTRSNWRRIAHIMSDVIYSRLTGEDGYFDSRIVYVAESGEPQNRIKRLAIMDQDGANHQYLTDGSYLVLTPRFSPTAPEITYLAYQDGRPRVYLYNIETGRQEMLGDFPGMTFAPRFSPDGNAVALSLASGGNTDIHMMDLRTRRMRQLTDHPAIDTAPSFSPEGDRIVFESDRSGTQQLYVMPVNGGEAERITFGQGRYANPVWSPRGDLIAFTRLSGGRFFIGVIRPNGMGERLITEAYHVEGPTWSPNGRVLMYFKETTTAGGRGRQARLYTIDITGFNEQLVSTPVDASDPAWSSLAP